MDTTKTFTSPGGLSAGRAVNALRSFGAGALDAGIQYDLFWPPSNPLLQTFGLRLGLVRGFDL